MIQKGRGHRTKLSLRFSNLANLSFWQTGSTACQRVCCTGSSCPTNHLIVIIACRPHLFIVSGFFPGLWVSHCCCNKLPQIQWLKITQIYYFTVLEVKSPESASLSKTQGVGSTAFHMVTLESVFLTFPASKGCLHSVARGPTSL